MMAARCSSSARGRALASGDGASYLYFGKGFAWAMGLANEVRERLSTSVISEHSMERMALGAVFVFRTVCFSP